MAKKLTNNQKLIGIAILILIGLFYWFQHRPSQIKISCSSESKEKAINVVKTRLEMYPDSNSLQKAAANNMFNPVDYDSYYKRCLQEKGL